MSQIHTAVLAVMHDIAKIGIAKTQKNEQQGYRFRGIEQAMNELSPLMVNHGITVEASYSELVVTERAKAEGKATRFVTLKGSFTFRAADDSFLVSEAYGEAMDSGDKAVIKAESVAFRTALFQRFVVPTMAMDTELDDGDDDDSAEMDAWRAAANEGVAALRAHYDRHTPTEDFWRIHGPALKAAAVQADKGHA